MGTKTWSRRHAAAWMLCVLLGGCGGGGDGSPGPGPGPGPGEEPGPPPDPLPPAGASRWAAIERDGDADGAVDSITLYSYDEQGRRSAARTYAVVAGVTAAEPTRERLWTFDRWSRIVGSVDRTGTGSATTQSFVYGADGRLASQHTTITPAGISTDTQFVRSDGRIVEARSVYTGSSTVAVTRLSYGDDGRVSSVDFDPSGEYYANYWWRADGRPAGMNVYSGFTASFGFTYDADGRLVATSYNDDGIYFEESHLSYDEQGRLALVERGVPPEGGDFAPFSRVRYRWEAGLCQPLVMPGTPPYEESATAGLISADNVSFGCAP